MRRGQRRRRAPSPRPPCRGPVRGAAVHRARHSPGKRRSPGSGPAGRQTHLWQPGAPEAVRVDEDPPLPVLCGRRPPDLPAAGGGIPGRRCGPDPTRPRSPSGSPGQMPLPCDFEVFRKDAHGVEILRRHAVPGRRAKDGVRCVFQCGCGKRPAENRGAAETA